LDLEGLGRMTGVSVARWPQTEGEGLAARRIYLFSLNLILMHQQYMKKDQKDKSTVV
jgi:hypothetical protein